MNSCHLVFFLGVSTVAPSLPAADDEPDSPRADLTLPSLSSATRREPHGQPCVAGLMLFEWRPKLRRSVDVCVRTRGRREREREVGAHLAADGREALPPEAVLDLVRVRRRHLDVGANEHDAVGPVVCSVLCRQRVTRARDRRGGGEGRGGRTRA